MHQQSFKPLIPTPGKFIKKINAGLLKVGCYSLSTQIVTNVSFWKYVFTIEAILLKNKTFSCIKFQKILINIKLKIKILLISRLVKIY